ncbi:MAG: hypothetical protein N2662_06945, partial [Bacteroidales bacterium]|nr:hypothetical protein [Bacteroidales bacterium]
MKKLVSSIFLLASANVLMSQNPNEPSGKIGGTLFGSYYYNVERDTAIKNLKNTAYSGAKDVNGFAVQRALIYYDYKLSNNLSSRFAIESDEKNFSVGSDSKANRFTIFLKDAWVQWRFHKYHG